LIFERRKKLDNLLNEKTNETNFEHPRTIL
jgi:hypothetical protein